MSNQPPQLFLNLLNGGQILIKRADETASAQKYIGVSNNTTVLAPDYDTNLTNDESSALFNIFPVTTMNSPADLLNSIITGQTSFRLGRVYGSSTGESPMYQYLGVGGVVNCGTPGVGVVAMINASDPRQTEFRLITVNPGDLNTDPTNNILKVFSGIVIFKLVSMFLFNENNISTIVGSENVSMFQVSSIPQQVGFCSNGQMALLNDNDGVSTFKIYSADLLHVSCCIGSSLDAEYNCGKYVSNNKSVCDPLVTNYCSSPLYQNTVQCNCINSNIPSPQCFDFRCSSNLGSEAEQILSYQPESLSYPCSEEALNGMCFKIGISIPGVEEESLLTNPNFDNSMYNQLCPQNFPKQKLVVPGERGWFSEHWIFIVILAVLLIFMIFGVAYYKMRS